MDARNQADSLIYSTEKSLSEHGDSLSGEDKAAIETAVADLKTAIEGDDADAIQSKTQALALASQKLGEALYKAQQEQTDAAAAPGTDGEDATVVDADFEEVDDAKDKSP